MRKSGDCFKYRETGELKAGGSAPQSPRSRLTLTTAVRAHPAAPSPVHRVGRGPSCVREGTGHTACDMDVRLGAPGGWGPCRCAGCPGSGSSPPCPGSLTEWGQSCKCSHPSELWVQEHRVTEGPALLESTDAFVFWPLFPRSRASCKQVEPRQVQRRTMTAVPCSPGKAST